VRAARGLTRTPVPREKKSQTSFAIAAGSHERAGGLLLLAAATETGLLTQLEQACHPQPRPHLPFPHRQFSGSPTPATHPSVSGSGWVQRTWVLRGYTAAGLALLDFPKASLWLSLYRSLFVASGPCRWRRTLHRCPCLLDHAPLASTSRRSGRTSGTSAAPCADLLCGWTEPPRLQ
jgi:hypothetical protein